MTREKSFNSIVSAGEILFCVDAKDVIDDSTWLQKTDMLFLNRVDITNNVMQTNDDFCTLSAFRKAAASSIRKLSLGVFRNFKDTDELLKTRV